MNTHIHYTSALKLVCPTVAISDLFCIYTAGIPFTTSTTMATYADDTAILCISNDHNETSNFLQIHLYSIN